MESISQMLLISSYVNLRCCLIGGRKFERGCKDSITLSTPAKQIVGIFLPLNPPGLLPKCLFTDVLLSLQKV